MTGLTLQLSFKTESDEPVDLLRQISREVQDVLDKYGVGDLARIRAFTNN